MTTTEIKQFTTEQQKIFFNASNNYAGSLNASVIIDMTKRYTGFSNLEIGAGEGHLISYFRNKYPDRDIVGIDIAPSSPLVIDGDCTDLQFDDKSFDTIFCCAVIEHLSNEDLKKCILEIHRVLDDGGYAIFLTKNAEDLSKKTIVCPECECSFHYNGHCQSFTVKDIIRIFKIAGFRIAKIRTLNHGYISTIGLLAKIFYFLRLQKIYKYRLFVEDIFFVVRKEPYWREARNSKYW